MFFSKLKCGLGLVNYKNPTFINMITNQIINQIWKKKKMSLSL